MASPMRPFPHSGAPTQSDVDSNGLLGAVVSTGTVAEKKGATEGEKREAICAAVAEVIKRSRDAGATNVGINVEGLDAQAALMELPANMMTPTLFCELLQKEFNGVADVETFVHDEVGLLKRECNQGNLVTGQTSRIDKKLMHGDMGGAATVCAPALTIAKTQTSYQLVVITPLCENLPRPSANKPGDVVVTMNGKTVEIDNTDAEGRLVLSDAIYYATSTYKTQHGHRRGDLDGCDGHRSRHHYSGVFTNSDALWGELNEAGQYTWDRFWRMPLDDDGSGPQIYGSNADLCNTGGRPGGSCTAALFLRHFVDGIDNEDATIR
ncbi:hypothetical protein FS837_000905 [Tulasnella sp. UAMH 9824]|nr:hypothetical protein FS837_000905 [Tulasnella sp. UAMH 9824]